MPDVAQTPPKADGGEVKGPNAEAKLEAQQKEAQKAQEEQARKDAKDAEEAKRGVKDANKQLEVAQREQRDKLLEASGTAVPSDKLETSGLASLNKKPTSEQMSAVGGQDQTQPDVGPNKMPETPTSEQMLTQEPVAQSVETEAVNKPEKPQNPGFFDGFLKIFGMNKEKTDDSKSKNDPHLVSEETVDSGVHEDIEDKIAAKHPDEIGDSNPEVGQDPKNKQ